MSGNDHEAIRERSHMLNTCPSKAGLPPFPSLLSPATRNDLAAEGSELTRARWMIAQGVAVVCTGEGEGEGKRLWKVVVEALELGLEGS